MRETCVASLFARRQLIAQSLTAVALLVGTIELECQADCVTNYITSQVWGRRNGINVQFHIPHNWTEHSRDEGTEETEGCISGETNCIGMGYSYSLVPEPGNFSVPHNRPDLFGPDPFTAADVIRYFDWQFKAEDGYSRTSGDLVFTRNCHGHTFDKDHWPHPDIYGVSFLVSSSCYEEVPEELTAVLVHELFTHSFKAHQIGFCEEEGTGWYIIKKTTEKNHCSPVYTRTGGCYGSPGNIDSSAVFPGSYVKLRPIP